VKRFIFTLTPKTAFATALEGDTLFGQCCWAILHLYGEARLIGLLDGYCDNRPFMVLSNALPQGFIARPTVPAEVLGFDDSNPEQRKTQKGQKWLPLTVLQQSLTLWAAQSKTEKQMMAAILGVDEQSCKAQYCLEYAQDHNSLNRQTGTTGEGSGFSPFQRHTFWYHPEIKLTLVAELDEARLPVEELLEILQWVGFHGYGKEASCGLGKFEIAMADTVYPELTQAPSQVNAWLTLAACAPQGLQWQSQRCFYQIFTRFGRHGDAAVHQGSPFKNPVLMAAPFAILTPAVMNDQGFTGQGLSGISKTIENTVQQGYAPVLPVQLELGDD
jgi:CRISPR-associated protein Csm4